MGASASVLQGSAGNALAVVTPSDETRKLIKMYSKEGFRQVKYYTKRGLRSAATGFTIASAVLRKLDVAGNKRRLQAMEEREVNRRKLLMAKKGRVEEDHDVVEVKAESLVVVAGDEDEYGSEDTREDQDEVDAFADLFGAAGDQGAGQETFYKESTADKLRKHIKHRRDNAERMRLKLATTVCDPRWMPAAKKAESEQKDTDEPKASAAHNTGMNVMAAVKLKRMVRRRRKEKEKNTFQASVEALQNVNLDAIDGTDVQGWNRASAHSVEWSDLYIYIIRAYGDCQKEVNVLYTTVLPKIRQVMMGSAVNVHLRDLGCISRPLPADRPDAFKAPLGIALNSIQDRNSICIVLVGFDYGQPWRTTSGTQKLKELGLDDHNEADFPEELSEFDILAVSAAKASELKHTVYKSKLSAPRTFVYTCVDPDSPFGNKHGASPLASPSARSPAARARSPGADGSLRGDGFKKKVGSTAEGAGQGFGKGHHGHGGESPLMGAHKPGDKSSLSTMSPLKLLKKKKKEEEKRRKQKLANLIKTVLPALIRDPDTGALRYAAQRCMHLLLIRVPSCLRTQSVRKCRSCHVLYIFFAG